MPEVIADRVSVEAGASFKSDPFPHNPARVLRIGAEGGVTIHLWAAIPRGTIDVLGAQCLASSHHLIRLFDHEYGRGAEIPTFYVLEARATSSVPGFISATLF